MKRALAIGGVDPSAGAGVLLDAAVLAALGYSPAVVVAVVTAQSSGAFATAERVRAELVSAQVASVAGEGAFRCAKIGALGDAANAEAIAQVIRAVVEGPIVLDPVVRSSSGGSLTASGLAALTPLLPVAHVVTPNAEEAGALTDMRIGDADDGARAAHAIAERWGCDVVVTGIPANPTSAVDVVLTAGEVTVLEHEVLAEMGDVRGTGCAFASSLAAALGDGLSLPDAVSRAQSCVLRLVARAQPLGTGRLQVPLSAVPGALTWQLPLCEIG